MNESGVLQRRPDIGAQRLMDAERDAQEERSCGLGELRVDRIRSAVPAPRRSPMRTTARPRATTNTCGDVAIALDAFALEGVRRIGSRTSIQTTKPRGVDLDRVTRRERGDQRSADQHPARDCAIGVGVGEVRDIDDRVCSGCRGRRCGQCPSRTTGRAPRLPSIVAGPAPQQPTNLGAGRAIRQPQPRREARSAARRPRPAAAACHADDEREQQRGAIEHAKPAPHPSANATPYPCRGTTGSRARE